MDYRIVLIMPNTSLLVGEGFTRKLISHYSFFHFASFIICTKIEIIISFLKAICPDERASVDDIDLVTTIMSAGGICEVVPEPLMRPLGAVSGCGVAFVMIILVLKTYEAKSPFSHFQCFNFRCTT